MIFDMGTTKVFLDELKTKIDLSEENYKFIEERLQRVLYKTLHKFHSLKKEVESLKAYIAKEKEWSLNHITKNNKASVELCRSTFGYTISLNGKSLPFDLAYSEADEIGDVLYDILNELDLLL